jgi:hypothetical protein
MNDRIEQGSDRYEPETQTAHRSEPFEGDESLHLRLRKYADAGR